MNEWILLIIKGISKVPIYSKRWECRYFTKTQPHPHTHTPQPHTHMCARWGDKHSCQKDNLETVTEQVCLESSLKRGGRIRVAECLQQIVLNGWASVRMFLCSHKGGQRFRCRMWIVIVKTQEAWLHLTMPGCHLILMGPDTESWGPREPLLPSATLL